MKKFIGILLLGITLIASCKKNNGNAPVGNTPIACFTLDKSTYAFNEVAIISNCSQNTTNYSWTIINSTTSMIIYTYNGDLSAFTIPSTIPADNYKVILRAYNSNGAYDETTKIVTITGPTPTTIGTPNPGPYTKLYINRIDILNFPAQMPNGNYWDENQYSVGVNLNPDMYIKILRQTNTGNLAFFDNFSDHFNNTTDLSNLYWNYSSAPKLINLQINDGFKLNIILADDEEVSNYYTIMSQILDVDLCSSANYGKPTLTFSQGDFSVKFTLQWSN